MSIRDLATGNGDKMGRLSIRQRLASAFLPFVGQHRFDASRTKPLSNVADRLLREVQRLSYLAIRPAFIAFQQHSRPRERSGVGFAVSHKHLYVASFVFAEVHRSWSSHQ